MQHFGTVSVMRCLLRVFEGKLQALPRSSQLPPVLPGFISKLPSNLSDGAQMLSYRTVSVAMVRKAGTGMQGRKEVRTLFSSILTIQRVENIL